MARRIVLLAAIMVAQAAWGADLADSVWVGGKQGSWGDSDNWSPAVVPHNTDAQTFNVKLDGGGDGVAIALPESRTIGRLDCRGLIEKLTGRPPGQVLLTLIDPQGLSNHGRTHIAALAIKGSATNFPGARLDIEDLDFEGRVHNAKGATIAIASAIEIEGGSLDNEGIVSIHQGSAITANSVLDNSGELELMGAGCTGDLVLHNNAFGTVRGTGLIESEQLIVNEGVICASGGSLLLQAGGWLINTGMLVTEPMSTLHVHCKENVNNFGILEASAGGGIVFDCDLTNQASGTIRLLGGTVGAKNLTQTTGAGLTGFGTIAGNLTLETDATINLTGPTSILGDVRIAPGASLEIRNGLTLITGQTTNDGLIDVADGKVVFQGGCDGGGEVNKPLGKTTPTSPSLRE